MLNTAADSVSMTEQSDDWLHVAAGVIFNEARDKILLACRPRNKHQGGKWEFPGGKVEAGESAAAALSRELSEELGISAVSELMCPFVEIRHCYPDKNIFLDVWEVTDFTGQPHGREGQEVRWFALAELSGLTFPDANTPIIEQLLQ